MAPQIGQWNVSRWGDGSVWGPWPQPQPWSEKMKKIQVAVNLRGLPPVEVVQRCVEIKAGVAGNATVFTNPDPPVVDFQTAITAAGNDITAADVAIQVAHEAVVKRDNSIAALIGVAMSVGSFVEGVANKSADPEATLSLANLSKKRPPTKIGQLSKVQNLSLTVGDNPGEVDGHWDKVTGNHGYEQELCTGDPTVEANWKRVDASTGSKSTYSGLTSGTRIWARVRAKAPKKENNGTWSQPATLIVP